MHTDRRNNISRQKYHEKEAENKLRYNSLCTEIQRMCNMKCMIIPVIIGAIEIVTKGLKKNMEAIAGKHSIDSLLGTSHVMWQVGQHLSGQTDRHEYWYWWDNDGNKVKSHKQDERWRVELSSIRLKGTARILKLDHLQYHLTMESQHRR